MPLKDTDREWERLGDVDPYYAVLSWDKYRAAELTPEAKAEFFESGRTHVELVLGAIRQHLVSDFRPARVLDFGCGVGRLLIPFATVSESVVGVDVSEAMLRIAAENCATAGAENVELVKGDDSLSRVRGQFDLVHSFIVFQHIRPARGEVIFRELIRLLRPGGVGVVHFTYRQARPRLRRIGAWVHKHVPLTHNLLNLATGRPWSWPAIEMNHYSLGSLYATLQRSACEHCYVRFTNHSGHLGALLFFQKQKVGVL
jgi:SAM-dependent methyltransferase